MNSVEMEQWLKKSLRAIDHFGARVLDLQPGYVKLLMPAKGNLNHIGTLYAGAQFAVSELPGGVLLIHDGDFGDGLAPIVKELTIRYLRPVTTDVTLETSMPLERIEQIRQEALANGKSEYVLEFELRDTTGTVVANTRAVYQLRRVPASFQKKQ